MRLFSRLFLSKFAIFFISICATSTASYAQKVYKCGNNYSQSPCAGGVEVDAADARTAAQAKASQSTTQQGAKAADQLEKSRLAQERHDLAANRGATLIGPATAPTAEPAAPKIQTQGKKRHGKPEYFTAKVPGESKAERAEKAKKLKAEKAAAKAAEKAAGKAATKTQKSVAKKEG